jgi:LmbE family N-acetylglucosaminyl deacetylase
MTAQPSGAAERVLVVLAHPDDPEYFCGATVARWSAEGREVTYCLVTSGDKGADGHEVDPAELARTREAEQQAAADVLGVRRVIFMRQEDGMLVAGPDLRRAIVRVIRQVRPDILISCDPTTLFPRRTRINHSDHRAVGMATIDAVYPAAGSALFFPELLAEGLPPHKVPVVYLAGSQDPDTSVDVTGFVERKLEALRCHRSQIDDFDEVARRVRERMRDPEAPPNTPRDLEHFRRLEPFG